MRFGSLLKIIVTSCLLSGCTKTFVDDDPDFFPKAPNENIIEVDGDQLVLLGSTDAEPILNTSAFVDDPSRVITCGDDVDAPEYRLEIDSCIGMKKSFFSQKTRLAHLEQGCAFHTFVPNGSTYIVKHVEQIGVTVDGRPHFRDFSRKGVMRANRTITPRSPSKIAKFRNIPDKCPAKRKGFFQ